MQWFRYHHATMMLLLIKILFIKNVASMICPGGFTGSEFHGLLYGLGYDTSAQICPPDNFLFSYICCDQAYFNCCIRFELWFM
ncbi:hypothetical protein ACH3XW_7275 [Acanthocheilonema viteae]